MTRLRILVVTGFIASVGVACGDSETPSSSLTLTPGTTFARGTTTLTYTDPDYGYSFEYPASWFLEPQHDVSHDVLLYTYDPDSAIGDGRPVPQTALKVFFWVAEGVNKPILDWLADGRNLPGQPAPPSLVSQSQTTLDGKSGIIEVTQSDDGEDSAQHTSYYISLGKSRLFVVNAVPGDSELWPQFESVLATVRFAN